MKKIALLLSFAFFATAASAQIEITSPGAEYDTPPPSIGIDFSIFNNYIALKTNQADPELVELADDKFVYDAVLNKKGKFVKVKSVKFPNKGFATWGRMRLMQAPAWMPATKDGNPVDINVRITLHLATIYPAFDMQGVKAFGEYVERKMVYPAHLAAQDVKGRALVSFTVLEDGSLDIANVKITNSPHQEITDAIMKVLREAPDWVPGMIKGVPQRFSYDIPITFRPPTEKPE